MQVTDISGEPYNVIFIHKKGYRMFKVYPFNVDIVNAQYEMVEYLKKRSKSGYFDGNNGCGAV